MWSFLISFLIASLISPLVIRFYKRHHWLDDPEKDKHVKKTHLKAVPRGGGLVIFFSVIFTAILFLNFDKYLLAILEAIYFIALLSPSGVLVRINK